MILLYENIQFWIRAVWGVDVVPGIGNLADQIWIQIDPGDSGRYGSKFWQIYFLKLAVCPGSELISR